MYFIPYRIRLLAFRHSSIFLPFRINIQYINYFEVSSV